MRAVSSVIAVFGSRIHRNTRRCRSTDFVGSPAIGNRRENARKERSLNENVPTSEGGCIDSTNARCK